MDKLDTLNKIKDSKEKKEVIDELIKINNYKIYLLNGNQSNSEIEDFVRKIINKYRSEILVKDYYQSTDGDHLHINTYNNLDAIETVIYSYIERKVLVDNMDKE